MRCFGTRVDPIRHTPQTVPVLLDDLLRCTQCVRRVLLRLLHVYMYVRFNAFQRVVVLATLLYGCRNQRSPRQNV